MVTLTGSYAAARHGGKRNKVTFGVLHSAETPIEIGYARSIAKMFSTTTQDKSAHYMVDPGETWGCLDPSYVAWHVGNGNTYSIGVEQAGYAAYNAEWTSTAGMAQMHRVATLIRELNGTYGFGAYWMTDAQLLAAHKGAVGGWATHDQCRRVLGGTTHTDPMPHYPLDQLMALVNGEDDMPDEATFKQWVAEAVPYASFGIDERGSAVPGAGDGKPWLAQHIADLKRQVAPETVGADIANRPTGEDGDPLWKVLQEVQSALANLKAGGGSVDLDALADKVADKLASRLGNG